MVFFFLDDAVCTIKSSQVVIEGEKKNICNWLETKCVIAMTQVVISDYSNTVVLVTSKSKVLKSTFQIVVDLRNIVGRKCLAYEA